MNNNEHSSLREDKAKINLHKNNSFYCSSITDHVERFFVKDRLALQEIQMTGVIYGKFPSFF